MGKKDTVIPPVFRQCYRSRETNDGRTLGKVCCL